MTIEDGIKLSEEEEQQLFNRLQPIIDKWKQGTYKHGSMCIYDLARSCYLTGLIIDGAVIKMSNKENNMSTDFGKFKSKRYNTIMEVYTSIKTDGCVIFLYEEGKDKGIKFVLDEELLDEIQSAIETAVMFNKSRRIEDE